jgi:hypothetical protein
MIYLAPLSHPRKEPRLTRALGALERGAALASRLSLELHTLTGRIGAMKPRARQVVSSAPTAGPGQARAAARSLMRSLEADIRSFTRFLSAVRGEYGAWLLDAERSLQFLFTPAATPLPLAGAELSELSYQIAALAQTTDGLKRALSGSFNQLQTVLAATAGIEELQAALAGCINELLQLVALAGRKGRLLQRLDVTASLLMLTHAR